MEKNLKKAKTLDMCTFHSCKMNNVILFGSIVQCWQGKQCATLQLCTFEYWHWLYYTLAAWI